MTGEIHSGMTLAEMQAAVDDLARSLGEKGIVQPKAQYQIEDLVSPCVILWGDGLEVAGLKIFRGNACHLQARDWIAGLPDPAEAYRATFVKMVADAIDFGNAHGVDADLVMPVQATFKALSENILTDQRAGQ